MEFGSLGGGEDAKHNGVGFADISELFAMQLVFLFGTELYDRVYI